MKVKYHDEFDHYKCLILKNIESPGLVSTFARLNFEILGISSPAPLSVPNKQAEDPHGGDEAQLSAELWGEPGMSLLFHF